MGYRHLSISCRCGLAPSRIDEVGITDDREIVVHWWCEECQRVVYAAKSVDTCWPNAAPAAALVAAKGEIPESALQRAYDAQFLQKLGIRNE